VSGRVRTLDKIPFSVYDFFAYLSSGVILLATADYAMGFGLLDKEKIGPVFAVFLIVAAYVCGQVIAHFSSFALEQIVVARVLKRPNELLLGSPPRWGLFEWLFPNYCRSLPDSTIGRVRSQLESRGISATGEGLFLHAYAVVAASSERQQRLDAFRNQYGFARNMCFTLSISVIAIVVAHKWGSHPVHLRWAAISAIAAIALFYRYLKFFRQFSYELFLRYAEAPPPTL
jgi:MFS family permease